MIQLIIDDNPIILDNDVKFKIIFDNPYFMRSSAYTRDIKIPMNSNRNKRVFGNITRIDVAKNITNYDVNLIVDEKLNLKGKAILRDVAESYITIQCVFENSQFNYLNKIGDKYIDELTSKYNEPMKWPFLTQIDLDEDEVQSVLGAYPTINWCWNPVYNSTAGEIYNKALGRNRKGNDTIIYPILNRKMAPQPYLGHVFAVICEAAGVWHSGQAWLNKIFGQLYIVNSTVTESLLDILPHWTFGEFFTEIEKFTGGVIIVEENRRLTIVNGQDYYTDFAPRKMLKVLEQYKVEIDVESNEQDVSISNIGYDLASSGDDAHRRIDDKLLDVTDKYDRPRRREYANKSEMMADIDRIYNNKKIDVEYYVYITLGRYYYAQLTDKSYRVEEFNRYRDIIKDKETEERIELRIVPAGIMTFEAGVAHSNTVNEIIWRAPARCPVSAGDVYKLPEVPTLFELLEDGKEEPFKKEIIEVAFNNLTPADNKFENITGPKGQKMPYPSAFCDVNEEFTPGNLLPKKFNRSLRLHHEDGVETVGDNFIRNYKIDRRIEYRFEILSRDVLNIRDVFIVSGHEYVAKKIELEISQSGINPIQTGEFYLLDK